MDVEEPAHVARSLRHAEYVARLWKVYPPTKGAYITYLSPKGVLLLQRSKSSNYGADLWEFPGGKSENGQSFPETAVKEFYEETGRLLSPDELRLEDVRITTDKLRNRLLFFVYYACLGEDFQPTLSDEHQDFCWTPLDRLETVHFLHPSFPHIIERSRSFKSPSF